MAEQCDKTPGADPLALSWGVKALCPSRTTPWETLHSPRIPP